MEYRSELDIAKQSEKMLTQALQHQTQRFADHYNRPAGNKSIKDAVAKAKVKRYGKKRDGNQKIYMRSLSIQMARHGFVHHFGIDTTRKGGVRNRTKPKATTYHYAAHYYRLKATPFLDTAIENSGVINYVADNIAQLRADAFGEELLFLVSGRY
ncbi:hypothetical protein AB4865_07415 [Capnocytophaga sp. ARDL2]|uniref:hypothetical protein n=1 Tax=Capnocytophaga sp. ARDL2 TaxID=3238809 RepID=UPI003558FE0F